MAVAELNVAQLSSYCSLPQQSINTLLDAPTADLVRSLLENISVKAHEHNELNSEKLKLGVELENAVRGGESKTRVLKASIERGLQEAAQLKQRLQTEEAARLSVQAELENVRTSASESTSELSTQKARIATLESSNRDTLSLLESKTTAYDQLSDELNAQHQKTLDLRRDVSNLEQSVQSANAASASAKFHEQGLQSEIESLKRSNDWLDKELKTKSEEYTKYRKEKGLRITELQRQCEEAQNSIDAANRTETTLRRRLDEVSQKTDESFAQIQKLQEEAAKKDESFKVELDAANRLTELTRNSANTERQRQQDLFAQLESAKEDASEQLGRIGAELETEHQGREAADARVAELEVQIEQLQAELSASHNRQSNGNSTHQGVNGFVTPTRGTTTPMGSPGTPRLKGGLSMTQMYSNYNDLKAELDFEKRRNEKLSSTLDDMIQDLENRQPEVEELRADHERLESEVAEMSSLVDVISKERDQAIKGAKKWEGHVEAKAREGDVLRQQLRDLSSQIKVLLMEVHLHNQGKDDLTTDARAQLERLAQGQTDVEAQIGATDTDRFISENLVTFRSVSELQEQNANLLKITREIGEKMEHEESTRKQLEETRNWEDLQQKYERCKDEVKSLVTQSQSYIRERDMFRRMLSHRGSLPPGADTNSLFGESVNGDAAPATPARNVVMNSVEDSPSAKDLADYAKLYKDMQAHFDAYRNEAATDRSTLKEQVDSLSKLNGELRSEVVRGNSQVTLAHERYEMLQANYAMLRNENTELQRRSQSLSDNASKQELRVQQVAEDLVEAKGLVDSMRNETANLKAEKDFWKTIEKRITEDNESLLNDRGRLNTQNANLQNILNEREHSEGEVRRRLQSQIDNSEKELQTAKSKLSEELEENKKLAQRREYDNEQSQKRINDLVSSLSTLREQLVAANTTKDHLSSRVDDLTIELRSAEERVHVLQPTPTSRPNDSNDSSHHVPGNEDSSTLSKEQELAVQVSQLKRDLDLNKAELENVKGQVEQYKAISQASEEELLSLNETHDLYRQETDKLIEDKNSKIKELEQRIDDTTSEIASTNAELSELRNQQAENGRRLDDQKRTFEAEIAQIKDQDERHAAAAQYYQEDLKVQADIAQQAQQSYENELVKHADAAKALQKVRAEYNELKLEIVEVKTEMESTRTNLGQNEESWAESRDRYERELADLKAGREDLTTQNNRLHQQLESVTAEISNLHKRVPDGVESARDDSPASGLENLQEVIKYLRREKEIVDVQMELSIQEGKRLKQQLDYTQSQLDDTRLRLNQQRRIEADNERSNLDHNKLMDTINELNTFRESSVTLRAESRQAQAALAARTSEVEELKARMEPLQAEILELKNERETQEGEMKLLKENCDRWQQRAQNVLRKYDRIDPAELESLKEQLKTLETERDNLVVSKQTLQSQVDNFSTEITQIQDQSNEKMETMRARLTDQFKAKVKTMSDRIREKDAALQTAMTEKQDVDGRLAEVSGLQNELNAVKAERDSAVQKVKAQFTPNESAGHSGSEDGQVDENETSKSQQPDTQLLQDRLSAAETRADMKASEAASLEHQLNASQSRIVELEEQTKQMQETINGINAEIARLQAITQHQADAAPTEEMARETEKLRQDIATAQQEADNLRTAASVNASLNNGAVEDGSKPVADQIAEHVEAVRIELEARHNERVKQTEELLEKRTNGMKANLTKKLTESKTQIRQSLSAEHQQALEALKKEHEQELERLRERHKNELDELKRNEDSRFAKLREAWDQERRNSTKTEARTETKVEEGKVPSPWQPTETEIRSLLHSNEVARGIIRKNILTQVVKAKDELSAQLTSEHDKSLAEAQSKANTAREHAVMMEGKKTAVQVNMANNKSRIAQFKIGLLEKAAQDTPDQPVKEVWTTVKDAKPPPVAPALAQQEPAKAQPTPVTSSEAQIAPSTSGTGNASQKPAETNRQGQPPTISTFGRPTPIATSTQVSTSSGQQSAPRQPSAQARVPPNSSATNSQRPPLNPAQNSLPQNPFQPAANHHPNAGTGPGVLRGLQHSGLPVARGGSVRGNPGPRGRGSGIGRGGPPAMNTNQAIQQGRASPTNRAMNTNQGTQQGRGSPTNRAMNPGAKQFVPGNKRPRDDEQQGGDTGNGKRIRGGGVGGGGA